MEESVLLCEIEDKDERNKVLVQKLKQVALVKIDYTDYSNTTRLKINNRTEILLELLAYIGSTAEPIIPELYKAVFLMTEKVCLRILPAITYEKSPAFETEEDDEQFQDPAWDHLELAYTFFMKFLNLTDLKTNEAKNYINTEFLHSVIELFDSKDQRERDFIKTIVHRIYGKFIPLRPQIRRMIHHVFYEAIYEKEQRNGIGEMLEIIGSIINGFAVPVKMEHKLFLVNCLMPLHKTMYIFEYFEPLVYCLSMYLQKDETLIVVIVKKMIRFWPKQNSRKEMLMLNELEEFITDVSQEIFASIAEIVAKQLAECLQSDHFQVAQRTKQMFESSENRLTQPGQTTVLELAKDNSSIMYPIIVPALSNNLGHWNRLVREINYDLLLELKNIDRRAYDNWLRSDRDGVYGQDVDDHLDAVHEYETDRREELNKR